MISSSDICSLSLTLFVTNNNLITMTFAGTTQKCNACEKTVYLVDRLAADNRIYHKACFRCYHCKSTLKVYIIHLCMQKAHTNLLLLHNLSLFFFWETKIWCIPQLRHLTIIFLYLFQLSNFNSFEGVIYCRPHFDQLFKRTGSLDKSFEGITKKYIQK